jgi:hypothetical protein
VNGRFNRAAIKAWQHDLTRIPGELNQLNASISQDEASSASVLARMEKEARVFIRPIDANIKALESQLEILENNQEFPVLEKTKLDEKAIANSASAELITVNSALAAKQNQVSAIQYLQEIQSAQEIMRTHPSIVSNLSSSAASLNAAMSSENTQASDLSYRVNTLRAEISNLEHEERLDQQRHAIENAHAYDHHSHHHHHDHHHGHHHHDDHQPNLFVSLLGAAANLGEFANDVGRSNRLSSRRGDLQQVIAQQSSHEREAHRLSQQYNNKNAELAKYQRELSQQQAFLVNVDYAKQDLARASSSSQLASDLYHREAERRELSNQQSALNRKLERANNAYDAAERTINRLKNRNAVLVNYVQDHSSNDNVDDLKQQLQQAEASRVPYAAIERNYLAEDAAYRMRITTSRSAIQSLTDLQSKQLRNRFLTSLRDNPQGLVTDFVTRYTNAVTAFDAAHPADQSAAEQTALIEMKNDVAYIQTLPNLGGLHADTGEGQPHEHKHEDDGLPHHPDRVRLYQLCGLLQAKAATIDASEEKAHSPLVQQLTAVTDPVALDRTETATEYQKLGCPLATPEYMMELTVGAYDTALAQLRTAADNTRTDVKELRKLSEAAKAVADSVDGNKTNVEFNILFYTKMLIAAKALLLKPSSAKLQNDFQALAQLDNLGLANNCKRGTGVAFLFLGAATLATSVLVDLGYIHIDAIPAAAKKAGYGVGGAGVAYGLWSLFRGREQGSVKASHNFSDAASHVPSTLLVLQNQQSAASSASRVNNFGSSSSAAPKTLFTPTPVVVVVQPVQANDPGYGASTDSLQHSLQAPLLNIDPSAPPPEYSEAHPTGYSPSQNRK